MLQQRASLILGLTHYELNEFDAALENLKQVVPGNEYYPQALMGLGWCYLKMQQFQNVIAPLEDFVLNYPDHHLLPESYLLLGQAHLKVRLYDKAIFYFNQLQDMFTTTFDQATADSLDAELNSFQKRIESQKLDLVVLEAKLLDTIQLNSRKWIPKYMMQQIANLEKQRSDMIDRIYSEKETLSGMVDLSGRLEQKLETRTKDWRHYAEYGISRVLFLQEQGQ